MDGVERRKWSRLYPVPSRDLAAKFGRFIERHFWSLVGQNFVWGLVVIRHEIHSVRT